ncbi:MAG TPA: epoxyalkane--coenzyme M transferase [Dehalococcoidia bacterium]|nr:epoxyalkane--coenzyme M transferase [Dehalococcoidia bacterium]
MHRSSDRILTTHPGRLPNPDNQAEVLAARQRGDRQAFDAQVQSGIAAMVRRQKEIGVDILSDGEFWKVRDQGYYDSRASGIETREAKPGEPASVLVFQRERRTPEFRAFWEIYDRVGNTPMPGAEIRGFGIQTQRSAITGPLTPRAADDIGTITHEIAVSKAAMTAAGARLEDCFFPVLSPNWLSHFVLNDYYKSEEEYIYALAAFFKNDYRAVVDAGFILQIDDPALVTRYGMLEPALSIEEYRRFVQPRVEALNWALEGIPEDRVRYHTCWGSWHTPHTTDIPFEHVIDLMLMVKAGAYSVETADARHELDWHVWETHKLPEGKVYIPGVICHKTTTIEPPELVADRIIRYAKLMGRENVIAGVDCGLGGRCYPDIGWAKLKSLADGAALASRQLWQ